MWHAPSHPNIALSDLMHDYRKSRLTPTNISAGTRNQKIFVFPRFVFHSSVGVKHLDGPDRQTSTGKLNWTVEKNKQNRRKINKIWEFDVNINGLAESFEYPDLTGVERRKKKLYEIRKPLMHRIETINLAGQLCATREHSKYFKKGNRKRSRPE